MCIQCAFNLLHYIQCQGDCGKVGRGRCKKQKETVLIFNCSLIFFCQFWIVVARVFLLLLKIPILPNCVLSFDAEQEAWCEIFYILNTVTMVLGKILFQISCKIHNQSESQNFSEHFIQKISALINNYTTMVATKLLSTSMLDTQIFLKHF